MRKNKAYGGQKRRKKKKTHGEEKIWVWVLKNTSRYPYSRNFKKKKTGMSP